MLEYVNVKQNICDADILPLLAPSVFEPTPEKLNARAKRYLDNQNAFVYACRKGGKYIGIAVVEVVGTRATVLDIAVDENNRNKGVGSALISFFIENFAIDKMIAETDDDAVGFYQKFGFSIAETKTVYDTKRYVCTISKK